MLRKRFWNGSIAAVWLCLCGGFLSMGAGAQELPDQVRERLRTRIEAAGVPPVLAVGEEPIHASVALPLFYEKRAYRPAWSGADGPMPQAEILAGAIREAEREGLRPKGYRCETLTVMSGYRTPYYNRAIGNVKYSRHVWGGAADIYIDESPRDGMMDDLNRDGKINYQDAAVLYDLIDAMYGQIWYRPFVGGLGQYEKTGAHGPFVHIDVRGTRARWGT